MEVNDIISSGLLELYAAGLASPEEALQVQQWASQYPEVADELAKIETSLELYAQVHPLQPGASVKEKILEKIHDGEKAKVVSIVQPAPSVNRTEAESTPDFWRYTAAAAVVLLIGSCILNFILYNKNSLVHEQLQQSRAMAGILEQRNREMNDYLEKVRSKYSTPVSLAGVKVTDASAKVFWMKDNGDVYVDPSNLPAPAKDKQYELWALVEGNPAPVNAGIIITTRQGNTYSIQKMKNFGTAKVQAFAVSVEKESKVPAVTPAEVFAMGKM